MRLDLGSGRPLLQEKQNAYDLIDEAAAAAHARYITVTPGQGEVYSAKLANANAYKAARYPMPCQTALYPWIRREADSTGVTPTVLANAIIAARATWEQNASKIEAARLDWRGRVKGKPANADVKRALLNAQAAIALL